MSTARVVITRRVPSVARQRLEQAGFAVESIETNDPPPRDELFRALRGANGVIVVLMDRVDGAFLDAAGPGLRIVANYAVGFDNLDLAALRQRGVRASNTPGVLTEATADIAWTLIMATARRAVEGDSLVRSGGWKGWYPTELLGLELHGATLGIVGAGRIGTATARRSIGFAMKVLYSHPRGCDEIESQTAARRVELEELLRQSHIVSLHIPMRPENRHLIDARRLRLLQDGALLINTARGAVVDEAALVAELRTGRIRAGLDVYEHEPRLTDGLAALPNVVLLPHLGSATNQTRDRMAEMAADNVIAALQGREPPNAIV